jgi:hypothetical protein
MKLEFSSQIFEKRSNMKFHQNLSSRRRVPCARTDGQTDMTKLIVACRNFANALKNGYNVYTKACRHNWQRLSLSFAVSILLAINVPSSHVFLTFESEDLCSSLCVKDKLSRL